MPIASAQIAVSRDTSQADTTRTLTPSRQAGDPTVETIACYRIHHARRSPDAICSHRGIEG